MGSGRTTPGRAISRTGWSWQSPGTASQARAGTPELDPPNVGRELHCAGVISATLDTSCALNFLSVDEDPDEALMELISLALARRLSLNVTEEAFAEVA